MKNIFPTILIAVFLLSSCGPATTVPEQVNAATKTVVPSPVMTQTPAPTSTSTIVTTQTLPPDPNTYECAGNVSREDCDFVKAGARIARYFFITNFGVDILRGVKFVIINDPNDIKRGEGGSAGVHQVSKQGESYVWINTGHPLWTEYSAQEYQHFNLALVVHEYTHEWQWQHGCLSDSLNNPSIPTGFLNQGYAGYAGLTASGVDISDYAFSDPLALSFWEANQWDENKWFDNSDVNAVVTRHLVEEFGFKPYTQYCDAVGQGADPNTAFQTAYGISIIEFREQFKDQVLGALKDCTIATCGAGVDNYSDKFKLKHLIDTTKSTPNIIIKFVDENNLPVALTHLSLWRQGVDGQIIDYAQPFETPDTFSAALLPGRYIFAFCEPGYPVDQSDWPCVWHETDWIEIHSDQISNPTFQVMPAIRKTSLSVPNLVVKFTDTDGNPIPDLGIQVCNYDTPVKVCNPTDPIGKTDGDGIYQDSLRSGLYLIRIPLYPGYLDRYEFTPFYEIKDIDIKENAVTSVAYQFPMPNLVVKFMDVNGSPVPEQEFLLCRVVSGAGDCTTPVSLWGRFAMTNKEGVFEAQVEPGEYYILTCKSLGCPSYDTTVANILVASETQVTTIEFPLYE